MKNRKLIGKDFEREAFKTLKKKFDSVEWLSENHNSPFDFKCVKDDNIFFGDAKCNNISRSIRLLDSQKKADFVIAKLKGVIYFLWKKDFNKYVYIDKPGITTIRCPMSTRKRLREYELHSRESDNDILNRLLNKLDNEAEK